jgi:hypothetical protein
MYKTTKSKPLVKNILFSTFTINFVELVKRKHFIMPNSHALLKITTVLPEFDDPIHQPWELSALKAHLPIVMCITLH